MKSKYIALLLPLLFAGLTGCDLMDNDAKGENVTVQFRTASSTSTSAAMPAGILGEAGAEESLTIAGSNGTLTITDIRFIVKEFELKRNIYDCGEDDSKGGDDDSCEKFEAPPSFVDLALNGTATTITSSPIEPDVYRSLEVEVEDLDFDDDDVDERPWMQALATQIRTAFPQWPDEASMIIVGTFQPTSGAARPFTVFAEAEIEVELDFNPPLVVEDGSETITVVVDPKVWFTLGDGRVLDLSAYNFTGSRNLLEFEVKMKNGFRSVERDDD